MPCTKRAPVPANEPRASERVRLDRARRLACSVRTAKPEEYCKEENGAREPKLRCDFEIVVVRVVDYVGEADGLHIREGKFKTAEADTRPWMRADQLHRILPQRHAAFCACGERLVLRELFKMLDDWSDADPGGCNHSAHEQDHK